MVSDGMLRSACGSSVYLQQLLFLARPRAKWGYDCVWQCGVCAARMALLRERAREREKEKEREREREDLR